MTLSIKSITVFTSDKQIMQARLGYVEGFVIQELGGPLFLDDLNSDNTSAATFAASNVHTNPVEATMDWKA